MNNRVSVKQNRRWLIWVALSLVGLIAAGSPWLTAIVYACQSTGGGC